jgi:hypothetical protein
VTEATDNGEKTVVDAPVWVAVPPEHDDGGWTVWTRGLSPNKRVCWIGDFPDSEAIAEHIAAAQNARQAVGDD